MRTRHMTSTDDQMSSLNTVLSLLMDECDIDDATLSRETNVPASTISRMRLNSDANPTASTLRPIARFFSISISQLLGDDPLPIDRLPGTHNPRGFVAARMPVIDWDYISNWLHHQEGGYNRPLTQWISTEKLIGTRAFALHIFTDSFGLAFRKGSLIIVDPDQAPKDGDLILLELTDDKLTVLKQFLVDGNETYIRSVNPEMKGTWQLTKTHNILGVIIETRYSMQEHTKNSPSPITALSHSLSQTVTPKASG